MYIKTVQGIVERRMSGDVKRKAAVGLLLEYRSRDPQIIDLYFSRKSPLEIWCVDTGEKIELKWGASLEINRTGGFEMHGDFDAYSTHVNALAGMVMQNGNVDAEYQQNLCSHLKNARKIFQTPERVKRL